MRFRKLRIVFSAICGIACVLLIALWVRSYWIADGFAGSSWRVVSLRGELMVLTSNDNTGTGSFVSGYASEEINEEFDRWNIVHTATPTWNVFFARGATLPSWFHIVGFKFLTLSVIFFVAALSPWIHWSKRFGLRTLLIATTLVAVLLGLVVYAARK
jgi:hypothetical protein